MVSNIADSTHLFIGLPLSKPRLLIPFASSKTQTLSFGLYNPGSAYGKLFKWFGQVAARVGLMKTAHKFVAVPIETFNTTKTIQPILNYQMVSDLRSDWEKTIGEGPTCIALSLGEPNYYRKVTALIFNKESVPLAFAKVGCTPQAGRLIANESVALEKLRSVGFRTAVLPKLLGYGTTGSITWLLQSAVLSGVPSPSFLQDEHVEFLVEFGRYTGQARPLASWNIWTYLLDLVNRPILPIKIEFESEREFIVDLCSRFQTLHSEGGQSLWPFTATHGDFAPWNIRVIKSRIALCDCEYFLPLAPAGWDILYFVFRAEQLVKKKELKLIWAAFEAGAYRSSLAHFEKRSGLHITNEGLLGLLVILAIVLDLVPKSICGERDF